MAAAPSALPWYFPASDAVVADDAAGKPKGGGKTKVQVFRPDSEFRGRILVAGCDPGISVLARHVQASGVELVLAHRNSSQALALLQDGCVHVAGTHLKDEASGESNIPEIGRLFPKKSVADWKKAAQVLNELREMQPRHAAEMIERVVEGFYAGYLKLKYPNACGREEDLHQLASFAMQFETVEDFLSQLALLTNLEADDASLLASGEQEFLRLSTVHQAKGQEWRAVFVIGLCDGMFPLARSLDNLEGEEEERRLFYVAVTRAKDELYLAYPVFRLTAGDTGGFQRPSRFLAELPKTHYQEFAIRHQAGNW